MRVTDSETMDVVEMVLGGQVNKEVVELINQAGGKAVGLTGQDGAFIRARKMLLPSKENGHIDLGQVGEIDSIDPSVIQALEGGGFIPVVAPIGTGSDGMTYNINADLVAGKLAEVLRAEKLVVLTNTPGVLDKAGKLLTGLTPKKIDDLVAKGVVSGGMLPKIGSALDAARSGVHLSLDARADQRLPEAPFLRRRCRGGCDAARLLAALRHDAEGPDAPPRHRPAPFPARDAPVSGAGGHGGARERAAACARTPRRQEAAVLQCAAPLRRAGAAGNRCRAFLRRGVQH